MSNLIHKGSFRKGIKGRPFFCFSYMDNTMYLMYTEGWSSLGTHYCCTEHEGFQDSMSVSWNSFSGSMYLNKLLYAINLSIFYHG